MQVSSSSGGQDHAAPVDGVGQGAAVQPEDDQWEEFGDAEQANGQRRVGELIDLEGHRDVGDHAAEERHGAAGEEQPKVPRGP